MQLPYIRVRTYGTARYYIHCLAYWRRRGITNVYLLTYLLTLLITYLLAYFVRLSTSRAAPPILRWGYKIGFASGASEKNFCTPHFSKCGGYKQANISRGLLNISKFAVWLSHINKHRQATFPKCGGYKQANISRGLLNVLKVAV